MSSVEIWFNTDQFPLTKDSYEFTPLNEVKNNKTEGGTIIRDIQRMNVPHISVSCVINDTWLQKLHTANGSTSAITVKYFSPETLSLETFSGFIENLKYSLKADYGNNKYWNVSFEVTSF